MYNAINIDLKSVLKMSSYFYITSIKLNNYNF